MMRGLCLLLIYLVSGTSGQCFSDCELYNMLQRSSLKEYGEYSTAQWVCVARKLSDSCMDRLIYRPGNGFFYGLFQISSKWCSPNSDNWCKTSCISLRDNRINDHIECLKHLIKSRVVDNWKILKTDCRKRYANSYVYGCRK